MGDVLNKKGLGFGMAMVSAIFWGTNGTFCALLSKFGLSSVDVAILGPTFQFIIFFVLLLSTNRAGFKLRWQVMLILMFDGLVLANCFNIAFVKSVSYFPVGIVSTLTFCNVFVIMVLSRIFFKNPITKQKVFAAVVSAVGVSLVLNVFGQGFNLSYTGLMFILTAMLAWSILVMIEKYLLETGVNGNAIFMYTNLFAVISLSFSSPPWKLMQDITTVSTQTQGLALLAIIGFGLIPQFGCYLLYVHGLKHIEPSYLQVAYSLDPVTASILGLLVFGQTMKLSQVLGVALIIIVVAYVQFKENQEGAAET